jgi:hypothetical protein
MREETLSVGVALLSVLLMVGLGLYLRWTGVIPAKAVAHGESPCQPLFIRDVYSKRQLRTAAGIPVLHGNAPQGPGKGKPESTLSDGDSGAGFQDGGAVFCCRYKQGWPDASSTSMQGWRLLLMCSARQA